LRLSCSGIAIVPTKRKDLNATAKVFGWNILPRISTVVSLCKRMSSGAKTCKKGERRLSFEAFFLCFIKKT
jgi:hypothetical protein